VVETEKQIDCGLLLLLLEIDSACNASKKPGWNPNSAEGAPLGECSRDDAVLSDGWHIAQLELEMDDPDPFRVLVDAGVQIPVGFDGRG
jgi:hypothetical protein